eukprot:4840176-Amphidinium_carterae.1
MAMVMLMMVTLPIEVTQVVLEVAEQTGIPIQALRSGQLGIPLEDGRAPPHGAVQQKYFACLRF